MDVILFQPASEWDGQRVFGTISNGLFAVAMFLRDHGVDVRICHFVTSEPTNKIVRSYIEQYNPKVVGINLSWHIHCAQALKIARLVKQCNDRVKVVIGGMSASRFYSEILEYIKFESEQKKTKPWVDLIVRGDGEKPLAEYLQKGKAPDYNASFINSKGKIVHRPMSYVQKTLPCTKLKDPRQIMGNWDDYLNQDCVRTSVPGLEDELGHQRMAAEIDLYIGKGCTNNCSYCGGCALAHKLLFCRTGVLFRHVDDVISDILSVEEAGVNTVYANFDPDPGRTFYWKLFKKLSSIGQRDLNLIFSCWSGPVPGRLIATMGSVFRNVEFVISPDSGSELLRKRLLSKGYGRKPFYSNAELIEFFRLLQEQGMKAMCYFTAGLPWETDQDWQETLEFARQLSEKFHDIFIKSYDDQLERNLTCVPLYVEAGSPIAMRPSKFGMTVTRKSFSDFLANSVSPQESGFLGGYNMRFSGESEVIGRCKEFNDVLCSVGELV